MRASNFYFFKNKKSKNIVEKLGLNIQLKEGFYFFSPLSYLIINKIIKIIDKILYKNNFLKVIVPTVQDKTEFYKFKKKRFVNEIYELNKENLILNPTCEEMFVKIFDKKIFKENIEEITFYSIGNKFRKEKRIKDLYKTREFIMCDLYSFCKEKKVSDNNYNKIIIIFEKILSFFKINFKKINKKEKNIRSIESTEFIVSKKNEIAHCFKLDKCYITNNYINCFGIGISRLYDTIVKNFFNKKKNFLKFININFVLIPTNYKSKKIMKYTEYIYKNKKKCLFDNRKIDLKSKIKNYKNFFTNIIIISNFCYKNKKVTILKNKKKIDVSLKHFLNFY
ncbi:Prolyl-tRNA synthetase, bacterial type [Candidatus Vidania fulgoroideae]|uniref:Prolyl-tRNA synthetase, bacterial type n=1 Tax=Candidatus Vidania fulgoroideorum TaxID=881286 RepID=A0A346E0M4_9PROT|nr:Prolyl-tRNA synthetase, bacterial type [Candidatus Vidania fulgoroideae]